MQPNDRNTDRDSSSRSMAVDLVATAAAVKVVSLVIVTRTC